MTLLLLLLDWLGNGDWRPCAEGQPTVPPHTTSQDHPRRLPGAAETAGVSGVCGERRGAQWLTWCPSTKVRPFSKLIGWCHVRRFTTHFTFLKWHILGWKVAFTKEKYIDVRCHLQKCYSSNWILFLYTFSFAGGTWDWEYLGFASPEVTCFVWQTVFL